MTCRFHKELLSLLMAILIVKTLLAATLLEAALMLATLNFIECRAIVIGPTRRYRQVGNLTVIYHNV